MAYNLERRKVMSLAAGGQAHECNRRHEICQRERDSRGEAQSAAARRSQRLAARRSHRRCASGQLVLSSRSPPRRSSHLRASPMAQPPPILHLPAELLREVCRALLTDRVWDRGAWRARLHLSPPGS